MMNFPGFVEAAIEYYCLGIGAAWESALAEGAAPEDTATESTATEDTAN